MTYLIKCVPNKTEDLNIHFFNMITEKNESKIVTKIYHANVNVNLMEENQIQSNSNQKWHNDKCRCECKNIVYVKKIIFGFLLHVVVKMVNIIDDSAITCDEIIEETKLFQKILMRKSNL